MVVRTRAEEMVELVVLFEIGIDEDGPPVGDPVVTHARRTDEPLGLAPKLAPATRAGQEPVENGQLSARSLMLRP